MSDKKEVGVEKKRLERFIRGLHKDCSLGSGTYAGVVERVQARILAAAKQFGIKLK